MVTAANNRGFFPRQLPCGCCTGGCICEAHGGPVECFDHSIDWYALSNGLSTVMPDGTLVNNDPDGEDQC